MYMQIEVLSGVVHGPEQETSSSRNLPFFLEPERFGISFSFTGTVTGILKSQINFVHKSFFAVNRAVF